MKALLFALLFVTLGDLAVDHGNGIQVVVSLVGGFCGWVSHIGEGSVFTR